MKKLSLTLALLGLSTSYAQAGSVDQQVDTANASFSVGAELLFVQTSNSFLYGKLVSSDDKKINNVTRYEVVKPDYSYGYHVDLGYHPSDENPSFRLGMTQLISNDTEAKKGDVKAQFMYDEKPGSAKIKSKIAYTDADLLASKEFTLQNRYHMQPYAGLRFASLNTTAKVAYRDTSNGLVQVGKTDNDFTGFGPRIGINAVVDLSDDLAVVAGAAGSALVGNYDGKATTVNLTSVNNKPDVKNSNTFKNHRSALNVSEVDYRLGVNYRYELSSDMTMLAELGYTNVRYFDVLSNNGLGGDTAGQSNWGYQGPYLRLQVNVA